MPGFDLLGRRPNKKRKASGHLHDADDASSHAHYYIDLPTHTPAYHQTTARRRALCDWEGETPTQPEAERAALEWQVSTLTHEWFVSAAFDWEMEEIAGMYAHVMCLWPSPHQEPSTPHPLPSHNTKQNMHQG